MKTFSILAFAATLLLCCSPIVFPQMAASRAGRLDREFADNGILVHARTDFFGDSLTLDDGSILQLLTRRQPYQSSRMVVVLQKYTAAGQPDQNFGTEGGKTYDFGYDAGGVAIARLADGKLLIAGAANPSGAFAEHDFLIFRIHPNGDLDTTFGNDGKVLKNFPSPNQAAESSIDGADAIYPMPDGKILVAGTSTRLPGLGTIFAKAIRLNADGSTDLTYGTDGSADSGAVGNSGYVPVGARNSSSEVDAAGRLTIGLNPYLQPGQAGPGPTTCELLRFGSDGALNTNFGMNGVKELTPGAMSYCSDIS